MRTSVEHHNNQLDFRTTKEQWECIFLITPAPGAASQRIVDAGANGGDNFSGA